MAYYAIHCLRCGQDPTRFWVQHLMECRQAYQHPAVKRAYGEAVEGSNYVLRFKCGCKLADCYHGRSN